MKNSPRTLTALLGLTILVGSCTKKDGPTGPGTVEGDVDISVALTVDNASPADGDTVRVTVEVTNRTRTGAVAASGLTIAASAPSALSLVAAMPGQGSFDPATGLWTIGGLGVGSSATATLDFATPVGSGGQSFEGSASVAALAEADVDPSNDSSAVTLSVQPRRVDIEVTKTADLLQPLPDSAVTFTVRVVNHGPGPISDLSVFDSLPVELLSPSHTTSSGTLEGDTLWTIATLADGDTATWVTTATVDPTAAGTALTNTALPRALAQADTLPANDTASVTLDILAPDVSLQVEANDSTPADGDTIQVTVRVTNGSAPGAVDVTGVEVTNLLDAGLTLVGSSAGQGTFDQPSGIWTVGSLAVAAAAELTLDVSTPVGGAGQTLPDSAWISALDQSGNDPANDTSSVVLAVTPRMVDVEILKTVDDASPLPDSTVTFTVSVINHGPGPVTGVSVFDTLEAAFLSPSHVISDGTLDGDSLWSIASMAQDDTITWMTTVTVDPGAAGGGASNTAFLAALDQQDISVSNDSATVDVDFPLSALPVVTILTPADSAIFDPGDLVSFTATATDFEDGAIPDSIIWASDLDGQLGTGASVDTDQLATGVHVITATARDSDGGAAADTIRITVALYTIPPTLNVPFGGTASLPITLSEPAPVGGVTLDISSADDAITTPDVQTVFILEGAQSSNATLLGLVPGVTTVTVSNPQYGAISSTVSVTAELDIQRTSFTLGSEFTETIRITFESQNVAIAAPAGGLSVTLTSADAGCVASASPITIPEGLIFEDATVTYGGSTALPCSSYLVATSPGVGSDSVLVNVVAPPTIATQGRTIGAGLQNSTSFQLPLSNHGGVTVTVKSSDPSILQVSPNSTTPGADSVLIVVPNGSSSISYYVQGVEGTTGSATVTVTATGFTDGSASSTVVTPGIVLGGLGATTTTLTADDPFYAWIGYPSGNSVNTQAIRAGGVPVTVTFDTDDTGVGLLTDGSISGPTVTAIIPVLDDNSPTSVAAGGVAHNPVGAGTATITVTASGLVMPPAATQTVTVSAPTITTQGRTLGAGLQNSTSFQLGASTHGGVTVTVTSSNPSVLQVSPNSTTPGAASIDVAVANGTSSVSYYVQGVEGTTGSATVTVTATGFTDGSASSTVVTPGIVLGGLSATTTTLTADDPFYAWIGYPSGNSVNTQAIRAGGVPVTVTFDTDDTGVGLLTDGSISGPTVTAIIPVLDDNSPTSVAAGGVAHNPVGAGTATITVTASGLVMPPAATQTVTVSAPTITTQGRTLGAGLQNSTSFQLGASTHGGVTVTVTSSNPSVLQVSPNSTTPGAASIDVAVANGTSSVSYYVQGVEGTTGSATVTVTATGFTDGSASSTVVTPGIVLGGLSATTTTLTADDPFYAWIGYPSGNSVNTQAIRAGGVPVTVTFDTDDTGVGLLTDGSISGPTVTAIIPVLDDNSPTSVAAGGVAHNPVGAGTATITATASGLVMPPAATQTVTVSAPTITTQGRTLGAGLQNSTSFQLGASTHGGVTVKVKSSNPSVLQVSPNSTTPGADSILIVVPDGSSSISYYVQGVEGTTGSPTVTVSAAGFTDGSATSTVVTPGVVLGGLNSSSTVGAADDPFYAWIGYPNGNSVSTQAIRAGGVPVTVTFNTDNTSVGLLTDGSTSGATVTAIIPIGEDNSPTSVAAGGVAHDPVGIGSATITAVATGLVMPAAATQTVTINP